MVNGCRRQAEKKRCRIAKTDQKSKENFDYSWVFMNNQNFNYSQLFELSAIFRILLIDMLNQNYSWIVSKYETLTSMHYRQSVPVLIEGKIEIFCFKNESPMFSQNYYIPDCNIPYSKINLSLGGRGWDVRYKYCQINRVDKPPFTFSSQASIYG